MGVFLLLLLSLFFRPLTSLLSLPSLFPPLSFSTQIQGEVEVKAQIKLRLTSRAGQAVVVSRSFSLTRRKAGLAFKALDQAVQTYDPATRAKAATTYRCADMDRLVPGLMGVSPAVLDNVVFVHQEDSNWPLADTVTLKKRFDDLFAATKYTKALEALRKLRLEQVGSAKAARLEAGALAVSASSLSARSRRDNFGCSRE